MPVVPGASVGLLPQAAQEHRLVGEDRLDGAPEVGAEGLVVAVVHEADEAGHGVGIEQVRGGRRVLGRLPPRRAGASGVVGSWRAGRVVLDEVQSADDGVDGAIEHGDGSTVASWHDRHPRVVGGELRRALAVQDDVVDAAAAEPGIGRHDLPARGPARVHALVVKDDRHPPTRRLFERHAHEPEEALRHPAGVAGEAHPRVEDEAVDAVGLEVGDLPEDLPLVQPVVPEPEGNEGVLALRRERIRRPRPGFARPGAKARAPAAAPATARKRRRPTRRPVTPRSGCSPRAAGS